MDTHFQGLLVIDKPGGMTSRAALDRCQRWFPPRTALGHTGTLDPLATGVLVVCVGAATRLADYVQQMSKTYHAVFQLGATSDSDDAEGKLAARDGVEPPAREAIARGLTGFIGEIEQVPPAYSAAKVTGRRAYELARRGRAPDLRPRRVHVHGIDLLDYAYPRLELRIDCGKGTYIRALARDLGERLGCGAHVASLRRERVGRFTADRALALDATPEEARARLLPMAAAVTELPALTLTADQITRLRHGQRLPASEVALPDGNEAAVFDAAGALVAVARIDRVQGTLAPEKVFH